MSKETQFFMGGSRPEFHRSRPLDLNTAAEMALDWAEAGEGRIELITQREAAKRLGVSVQFLRTLDGFFPPRGAWGRGHEALYAFPSCAMWFLSLGVAKNRKAAGDSWAWSLWLAEQEELQAEILGEIESWQARKARR